MVQSGSTLCRRFDEYLYVCSCRKRFEPLCGSWRTSGIFRSINNGSSWTQTGLTTAHSHPPCCTSGTNLFAGRADSKFLLCSTDMGGHMGLPSTTIFQNLVPSALSAANGMNVFAGISHGPYPGYGGVCVTTNNGHKLERSHRVRSGRSFFCTVVSDTNVFAADEGGQGTAGGFISTDNGISWKDVAISLMLLMLLQCAAQISLLGLTVMTVFFVPPIMVKAGRPTRVAA